MLLATLYVSLSQYALISRVDHFLFLYLSHYALSLPLTTLSSITILRLSLRLYFVSFTDRAL